MNSLFVLTLSAADRPGLVKELAEIVASHDGNWEVSRMAHLGGRFVGLLQVSLPTANIAALRADLEALEGLSFTFSETAPASGAAAQRLRVRILGNDRPGIVHAIFRAFAEAGANVEELHTTTRSAPETGMQIFEASAWVAGIDEATQEAVCERIEAIAHDIMVDVWLESDDPRSTDT